MKNLNQQISTLKSQNTPHLNTVSCCSTNKLTDRAACQLSPIFWLCLGVSTNHLWLNILSTGADVAGGENFSSRGSSIL